MVISLNNYDSIGSMPNTVHTRIHAHVQYGTVPNDTDKSLQHKLEILIQARIFITNNHFRDIVSLRSAGAMEA